MRKISIIYSLLSIISYLSPRKRAFLAPALRTLTANCYLLTATRYPLTADRSLTSMGVIRGLSNRREIRGHFTRKA